MRSTNRALLCTGVLLFLAACGSGNGTQPPQPAPTNSGGLSPSVQRQAAQGALTTVRPLLIERQVEHGLSAASFARKPLFARARRLASSSCSNGIAYTSSTSGTTTSFTLDLFYDSACTLPWQVIAGTETASATITGPDETIAATDTIYGKAGAHISYDTIHGTLAESQTEDALALDVSAGPNAGDVTAMLDADCSTGTTGETTTESCTFGDLATLPAFMGYTGFGTLVEQNATVVEQSSSFTESGTGTGGFFEGIAPPMMQLENSGTSISISGAYLKKTLSETLNVTDASGAVPTGTVSITDATDNAIVIFDLSGSTISGEVENAATEAVVATFTLDVNGNGTISYSNGTTGTVVAFGIVS